MHDAPLREVRQSARAERQVRWPGAPQPADPWSDTFFLEHGEGPPVDGPGEHDRNTPAWGMEPASIEELVRVCTDLWPSAGNELPDLVLGRAALFATRRQCAIAVAGGCFLWGHERWPSAFTSWCRSKPKPAAAARARVRAVGLAPWALWRVERDGDAVFLHDHTGLAPTYRPQGPVRLQGEAPTGEGLAARVVRTDTGWIAHTALDVPALPSREQVQDWVHQELREARRFRPEIRLEPLLRHRAVLVRRALSRVL